MKKVFRRGIIISALLGIVAVPAAASASDSGALAPPFTLGPVFPITDEPKEEISGSERLAQIAVEYAEDADISQDEALRRLKVQQAANGLTVEAKDLLGDEYAGVWFDTDTGDVKVGITSEDQRPAVEKLLAEHVNDGDGAAVLERSSRADLEAALADLRPELAKRSPGIAFLAVDDAKNRVVIGLSKKATEGDRAWAQDARRDFAAGRRAASVPVFPADAVELAQADRDTRPRVVDVAIENVATEAPVARACVRPHCGTPLRAGVGLGDSVSYSFCTTAFYGRWWNAAQSRFEMYPMTAGHCMRAATGSMWAYHQSLSSWKVIGPRHTWRFGNAYGTNPPGGSSTSDIAVMRAQESPSVSYWYTTENAKLVMWGWPNSGWDWWSISGQDIAAPGRYGCRTGITTNYTCGSVQYQSISAYYNADGTTVDNLFTVPTACSNPGDSGGPFIDGGTALGILSGGPVGSCTTYFAHVWDVGAALGVWVATTPPRR